MSKKSIKKVYNKICENCNDDFTASRPHAKYCSDSCRMEKWRSTHPYLTPEELKAMKEKLGIK